MKVSSLYLTCGLVLSLILNAFAFNPLHSEPKPFEYKTQTRFVGLYWNKSSKEYLIIASDKSEITKPKKGITYKADSRFGEGTKIGDGFVAYKGKGNAVTVNNLTAGNVYYFVVYEIKKDGDYTPVDLEINTLNGYSLGLRMDLVWKCKTWHPKSYFIIERSTDGKNWKDISRMKAVEESGITMEYAYRDNNPADGINYYRIKQCKTDSDFVASESINLHTYTMANVFEVLPFETLKNTFTILSDIKTEIVITNDKGETYKTIELNMSNEFGVMIKDFPEGIYLLNGTNSRGTLQQKIVISN